MSKISKWILDWGRPKNPVTPEFLSPRQIADDMMDKLDDFGRNELRSMKRGQLVQFHFTTGMWIRNHYKLWNPLNPYTIIDPQPNEDDILDHPQYPDTVAMRIIEDVWERLNK